jgi:cytochrome c biogenesis protein CcdA/glutaredoxin
MAGKKNKKTGTRAENTPANPPDQSDNRIRIAAVLLAVVVLLCTAVFGIPLVSPSVPAQVVGSTTSADANATITATYFYGDGCVHCEKIKPFIADIETRYPELRIEKLESYRNITNNQRFLEMNRQYGIHKSNGFPTVFIGRNASSGETEVRDHFEEYILAEKQRIATGTPEEPVNLTPVDPGSPLEPPALNLLVVVFAALVDSINPCAFAVLIILIAYLTSLGERRRIAVVGCTYIATVFIVYFIAGLGLLTFVQGIGLTGIVFTFAAVVAILAGLINIAEVLLRREIFTLAIPGSQKDAIDRYIKKASVPSAIVLGGLVAMVELPCTGGIYLAILGLLGDRMTLAEGIPYLLLYNLIFVLPLVLILMVMYWGGTPERLEEFRSGSKRWVRLVMGIVMVVLGAAMLLGVI